MKCIKQIFMTVAGCSLIGCTSEAPSVPDTLAGNGQKTPLAIAVSLDTTTPTSLSTRATSKDFEESDELVAYIQHVIESESGDPKTYTEVSGFSKLVTFTKGISAMESTGAGNVNQTSDLTVSKIGDATSTSSVLYWDDFSSNDGEGKDLRTTNHGLRSFYGYCYNGGTPSTPLTATSGELGWTVQTTQTSDGLKKSDLLWSKTTDIVRYAHGDNNSTSSHGTLTIPYTHALSKVTIVLQKGAGFTEADPFSSTSITLHGAKTTANIDAVNGTISDQTGNENITMHKSDNVYEAIVIPTTEFNTSDNFATITDVEGNDYTLTLTADGISGWGPADGKVSTQSGVNYKLTVTLDKQQVHVVAQLTDWQDKEATATAKIQFNADVVTHDKSNTLTGTSFDLYRMEKGASDYTYATTSNYNGTESKWENTPLIYWENARTSYHFRAIAECTEAGDPTTHTVKSVKGEASAPNLTNLAVNGKNLVWATTPTHTGTEADGSTSHNYNEGIAIPPRTGTVPLEFRHIMTKLTIKLATTEGDDKVELNDAVLTLSGVYTEAGVKIATGEMDFNEKNQGTMENLVASTEETVGEGQTKMDGYIVLPQTLDNAKLTITLNDAAEESQKTKYSVQLKECTTDGGGTPTQVSQWEAGKHYTYTLTLKKEAIGFVAFIKEWDTKETSGDANLDWD